MADTQDSIEYLRVQIEHLRLENENLRLQNENIRLRTQDSVVNTTYDINTTMDNEASEVTMITPVIEEPEQDDESSKLFEINLLKSQILSCNIKIDDDTLVVDEKELNYTRIARKIWELTPRQTIYDKSTFNSKDYHYSKHGYKWIYEIQLSMQIGNTMDILKEIVHMCKLMNFGLDLSIKQSCGTVININISKSKKLTYDVNTVNKPVLSYNGYGYFNRYY
jgi:regulator of replication initiation timing